MSQPVHALPPYIQIKPVFDLKHQTVELSNLTHERVSRLSADGNLKTSLYGDALTVYEAFRRGARASHNGDCLGYRKIENGKPSKYHWIKYDEVIRKSENIARGIIGKISLPGQSSLIGVYSSNRPEWIMVEQACYVYSMVLVPLYDTLGMESCSYIIQQTEMTIIFIDKSKKAELLLEHHSFYPHLHYWVIMDEIDESLRQKCAEKSVEVIHFSELEHFGEAFADAPHPSPPQSEMLATICYTSGTTGMPKGAMLTHGNIIADASSLSVAKYAFPAHDDILVSYLPLAHMFERILETMVYSVGGRVGFFRGDIKLLPEDLVELRPTIMPTVPRLLNRLYDKVMSEVNKNGLKKCLFNKALASKVEELRRGIVRNNSCWDKIVFKKVRNRMGGRVRLMITGSAPCSPEILTFVRAALGCIVMEGYGQTECVAAATVTMEGDHIPGHVGPPVPCCKIKLVDVPEMNYFAKDNTGEVWISGPHVFKGYYRDEPKTVEALDSQGWLHTGDIGKWTQEGTLKLIDRKKHIFKLSQGEYIAPEKIENVYMRSKYIANCFVYGESIKSHLVAIVVPDAEVLIPAAEKLLHLHGAIEELCKKPEVNKLVFDDMITEAKRMRLASFEQAKVIYLHPEIFSVENGLLTPTFKSKRPALKDYFKSQLDELYKLKVE